MGGVIPVQPLSQGTPAQHAPDSPVNQGVLVACEQPDNVRIEVQGKRFVVVEEFRFSQVALILM
ncbi:hypothetical protein D9M71_707820 [compost metagenome]